MPDLIFEVVGRSKSEKVTKEGNVETTYKVMMQTADKKHKFSLTDASPALLAKYPLQSDVPVSVGKSNQLNLVSEEQLKKELEKAEEEEEAR
jgi:hypothetical protein